uniref:Uncharacterized protein n=2 Tax=Chloropicon roscoffensis TaxID=1461544 RepID=A0A7S3FS06_9CHLO|mmetsp:Transcript_7750/g.23197  ORF Transcript_7750/g.23197 Transcript_7750/m.23197 type:complete len:371 (+) Transcript_7750:145-1257(+)
MPRALARGPLSAVPVMLAPRVGLSARVGASLASRPETSQSLARRRIIPRLRAANVDDNDLEGESTESAGPRLTLEGVQRASTLAALVLSVRGFRLAFQGRREREQERLRVARERAAETVAGRGRRGFFRRRSVTRQERVASLPPPPKPVHLSLPLVMQAQILLLGVALGCGLLGGRGRESQPPKGAAIAAPPAGVSQPDDQVWRAVTRVQRQLSRTTVKQRIARRDLQGQVEAAAAANEATGEALVEYSKEFRKLQGEVAEVYALVAGLEGAMRSQLGLIGRLVEGGGGAPGMSSSSSSQAPDRPEQIEGGGNNLQRLVVRSLSQSSGPFDGRRGNGAGGSREVSGGDRVGDRKDRSVEVSRDGQIYHFD